MLISSLLRGHIDAFELLQDERAHLRGWIFREDTAISRVDIGLQGAPWVQQSELSERPDVKGAYEALIGPRPHLGRSGFDITAPVPFRIDNPANTVVEITPYTLEGRRLCSLLTHFSPTYQKLHTAPLPPAMLQERVGGSTDFIQVGAQLATLIMTYVRKYKSEYLTAHVLDWGCGCGRVIAQMLKFIPAQQLHGCDIDAAAIQWNQRNITGPVFTRVQPYPPTPYNDDAFDVIYGISVMTHLAEETQILWLKELQRITRPGAIILLSVIGEELRRTNMPLSLEKEFNSKGFATFIPNYSDMLSEFAHAGYYRETYHTLHYIASTWGLYFEILEYVETKHQDVVILRKLPSQFSPQGRGFSKKQ